MLEVLHFLEILEGSDGICQNRFSIDIAVEIQLPIVRKCGCGEDVPFRAGSRDGARPCRLLFI